jgi:hypothetical protein
MSELKVNKISPRSGTDITLGDSGDAISVASGASLTSPGLTLSDNILFNTSSKGIYLGVTSATAANLLDDYEEGTFTPSLENGTVSYTSRTGQYIKVGKLVFFSGTIVLASNDTGDSSSVRISGFPFTIDYTNNSILFTMNASLSTLFDNYHNVGGAYVGTALLNSIDIGDTSTNTAIQYEDLQASGTMVFSGQYIST